MSKVAVLGYGTVGSGVVEVITGNRALIEKRVGKELDVKYILDIRDFPGDPHEKKVVHDINIILEDPEVDIVCETMGGTGAAYTFTKACLEKGKSVCTSNKALVAAYGPELMKTAEAHQCSYMFEASVGGGIPIIRNLNECLLQEKVDMINGILNGTTNYMLTKIEYDNADYDAVLKEAQALGYAERDPSADVEGYDTCRKIAILASLMMGKSVDYEKIPTEGITKITPADFAFAHAAGMTIKLLGNATYIDEDHVYARVAPFMMQKSNSLAAVCDVFNAVQVKGNMVGETMFYGSGAGKLQTASAVVADVIQCVAAPKNTLRCLWKDGEASVVTEGEGFAFYVRAKEADRSAVMLAFMGAEELVADEIETEFALLTPVMKESDFEAIAEKLGDKIANYLRLC